MAVAPMDAWQETYLIALMYPNWP